MKNRTNETEIITQGIEVGNLEDTLKTEAITEDTIIVHFFQIWNFSFWQRLSSNEFQWFEASQRIFSIASIFIILQQISESDEQIHQWVEKGSNRRVRNEYALNFIFQKIIFSSEQISKLKNSWHSNFLQIYIGECYKVTSIEFQVQRCASASSRGQGVLYYERFRPDDSYA